jgi:hypothetical protein
MAIGTSTIAIASEGLKTYFMPPIIKQLSEDVGPVFAAIEKKNQPTVANKFIVTLEYGRHGGIGARDELGPLPPAAARFSKQAAVESKNLMGRFQISEKLIIGAKNNSMAFVDEMARQTKNLVTDAKDMLRRNFNSRSLGVMGTVKTAISVATSTVAIANGKINTFYEGQIIDILTPPSTYAIQGAQIINVDRVAETIKLDRNVTSASVGQVITLAGNYGKELTGLGDILEVDTTLYGIDRSQNKWFNPSVFDETATGGFDSMWMQRAIDDIQDNTGDEPKFFVCDRGVQRAYVDEQNTYKRIIEMKTVDGGYKLLAYNDIPISPEKYFPGGQMGLLTLANFIFARLQDWDWMDQDGNVLKHVSETTAYEAILTCYAEVLCGKPGSNALIKGITEI